MTKLEKLIAQLKAYDVRMKEIRALEGDAYTDEIDVEFRALMTDIEKVEGDISTEERALEIEKRRNAPKPNQDLDLVDPNKKTAGLDTGEDRAALKPWKSFGEQMVAVYRASLPEFTPDVRLLRAATGLNEGVPSEGGFLVQTDFSSVLINKTFEQGDILPRVRKIPISANSNGLKMFAVDETSRADGYRMGGMLAYWAAEGGDKTASQPKFREMGLNLHKLIGLCYATDELLEDAVALEALLMQAFPVEFDFKVQDAVINGTGAGQPAGILGSGAVVPVPKRGSQPANTILYGNITDMWSRLWIHARRNSVWLINQDVEPQLNEMSIPVGTGGAAAYMPANGLADSPFSTLMGRPVIPIEQCQTLGTKGDIMLVDFSQYVMIDKGSIDAQSSIHVRFVNDETCFRFVYRCDGQSEWAAPMTPKNGTKTVSPFITLATRS